MTKTKSAKHGIWFDFFLHIQIHRNVLAGWSSSMITPQTYQEVISGNKLTQSVKFRFAHNGYEVHILKIGKINFLTDANGNSVPQQVKTESFKYMAFNQSKNLVIRICSPQEYTYNPNFPWHWKTHRHDVDGPDELITVFSNDDRPLMERLKHKYMSGKNQVKIQYTPDETWPHLSEFFSEVFKLS